MEEKYWVVVIKLGGVYHEVKMYKRKNNAIDLRDKLRSNKPLEKYELVRIKM